MFYHANEEITSSEPLHSKFHQVFIKNICGDEKQKDLRITVDFTSSLSKVSRKVLHLQLTDDEDPYFLYSLIINEDDYIRLKSLQGLLVDFDHFPAQIVRLLQQSEQNNNDTAKFLLLLEDEKKGDNSSCFPGTYLKIVETNNFKHLCHLYLQVEPGNDNDIKKLMLRKIKRLTEKISKNDKYIQKLNDQVNYLSKQLDLKEKECNGIQQKWSEDKLLFKAECSKELNEETEKLRKSHLDWQIMVQKEKNDMEDKYENIIREKDAEILKFRAENQIALDKKNNSDRIMIDQNKQIDSLNKELTNAQNELSTLRRQNAKLDGDYHEKEKLFHSLKTKLAVQEQEIKDNGIMLNKQQEHINSLNEQRKRLEENLAEKEKIILRKQATLENLTEEIVKANEIITKLQKELTLITSKLKLRTNIAFEQEKVVEANREKIISLEEQLNIKEKKLEDSIQSELHLTDKLTDLTKLLESKEKILQENEKVIGWLNKKIIELKESPKIDLWSSVVNGTCPSIPSSTPFSNTKMNTPPQDNLSVNNNNSEPVSARDVNSNNTNNPPVGPSGDHLKSTTTTKSTKTQSIKSTSTLSKSVPDKKSTRLTPGFKRISLNQTSTIPSSYFLK